MDGERYPGEKLETDSRFLVDHVSDASKVEGSTDDSVLTQEQIDSIERTKESVAKFVSKQREVIKALGILPEDLEEGGVNIHSIDAARHAFDKLFPKADEQLSE